jgi:hypothetical protein
MLRVLEGSVEVEWCVTLLVSYWTLFCETSWLSKLLDLHDDEVETGMVYEVGLQGMGSDGARHKTQWCHLVI